MTDLIDVEKLLTYSKRYGILSDKLKEYFEDVRGVTDMLTHDQFIYHIDLLNQALETQASMTSVYIEGINRYNRILSTNNSALMLYANEFGSPILAQRAAPDDTKFKLEVTLFPLEEHVSVTVNSLLESEDEHKHNRRRSYYKKITDGIALFRQSLRKP